MRPDDADLALVWDMHDAAVGVVEILRGKRYSDFRIDRSLRWATERGIEIVGQAARLVSDEFKEAHPEIPWSGIVAQRHVLAHEYKEILVDRIWIIVSQRMPELMELLEPLMRNSSDNADS